MRIYCVGSRFWGGQIDRVELGLIQLGHMMGYGLNNKPDLIYSNDMSHAQEAIDKWHKFNCKPKLILNVLDVPYFVPQFNDFREDWHCKLLLADKVTCISKTVQKDIKDYFDIEAEVIYNPIKPLRYLPGTKRDITALFVGRAGATNKRVYELIYPLYTVLSPYLGKDWIHFVGSECPNFGISHGIVSDEKLNEIYNRTIFTLIPSKWEGLNLPLIESLVSGSVPVVCRDMSTANEFAPDFTLCDPTPEGICSKIKELSSSGSLYFKRLDEFRERYSLQFAPISIAKNIISVYNQL